MVSVRFKSVNRWLFALTVAASTLPGLQTLLHLPLLLLIVTLFDQPYLHSSIHLQALFSSPEGKFTVIISQSPLCWALCMPAGVDEKPNRCQKLTQFILCIHIINLSHVSWLTDEWLQEFKFPCMWKNVCRFCGERYSFPFLTTHILQYGFTVKTSLKGVNKLYLLQRVVLVDTYTQDIRIQITAKDNCHQHESHAIQMSDQILLIGD